MKLLLLFVAAALCLCAQPANSQPTGTAKITPVPVDRSVPAVEFVASTADGLPMDPIIEKSGIGIQLGYEHPTALRRLGVPVPPNAQDGVQAWVRLAAEAWSNTAPVACESCTAPQIRVEIRGRKANGDYFTSVQAKEWISNDWFLFSFPVGLNVKVDRVIISTEQPGGAL